MRTKTSNHWRSAYCHKAQPFQSISQRIIINYVKWPIFYEHCIENIVRYSRSLTLYFLLENIIYCKYYQLNESIWVYSFSCIIPMPIVSSSTAVSNPSQRVASCKWAGLVQGWVWFFFPSSISKVPSNLMDHEERQWAFVLQQISGTSWGVFVTDRDLSTHS